MKTIINHQQKIQNEIYKLPDALELPKKFASKKFDESLDLAIVLGVDVKKSDQLVRGIMSLPKMPEKKLPGGSRERAREEMSYVGPWPVVTKPRKSE